MWSPDIHSMWLVWSQALCFQTQSGEALQSVSFVCFESAIHQSGSVVILLAQHSDVRCKCSTLWSCVNPCSRNHQLICCESFNSCFRMHMLQNHDNINDNRWCVWDVCYHSFPLRTCCSKEGVLKQKTHSDDSSMKHTFEKKKSITTLPWFNKVTHRTDTVPTKRALIISWEAYRLLRYRFPLRGLVGGISRLPLGKSSSSFCFSLLI